MISLTDFSTLTKDLHNFFGKKYPFGSQISKWHEAIEKFKENNIRDAFDWMKKNLDSPPKNLPKAINSAIFKLNRHSDSGKDTEYRQSKYGQCDDCNGTGIFKKRVCGSNGLWYEPIQFCSKCDNWKSWTNRPGTRISRTELEAMGIVFEPYNKPLIVCMESA